MTGPVPKGTILGIEPYRPGKAKVAGFDKPIKLSANENALGCSATARAAFVATQSELHRYPDPRANALREAIAAKHGLDPARIVFGDGTDEIFSLACQAYLSPGDVMVQPQYAFAAWAIAARAAGAEVMSAPERNYTVNVDAMLAAVNARTKLVFVADPANPTGTQLPPGEIARLHAGLPDHVLFVLDQAYAEFGADADAFRIFADAPNVIITRTFSKLYGLANLRIGWGYAPAPVADVLNRIRLPFNTSAPAQAAALAALADEAFVARSVEHAVRGREKLAALVRSLGLEAIAPAANFVTVRVPASCPLSAAQIDEGLAARGVIVRALDNYGMPDCIRITIGLDEEMVALERGLRELLA
ncbi:MAG: histidinol-phosphate transaminase [Hyphomonadaceae bacterium]